MPHPQNRSTTARRRRRAKAASGDIAALFGLALFILFWIVSAILSIALTVAIIWAIFTVLPDFAD